MKRKQTAWLLTWEWASSQPVIEDKIAAILRPHLSWRTVGEIVECLYAIHAYTPTEQANWSRQPKQNPHKVQWSQHMHCFCGHDPFLEANYVVDLSIETNPESGLETIQWVLPPLPRFNKDTGKVEEARGKLHCSTTRKITGPLSNRDLEHHELEPETWQWI